MLVREKQLDLTTRPTNAEGTTLVAGEVVVAHTTADQVVRASAAADNALAGVYGIVLEDILSAATGQIVTKRGTLTPSLFETGLTLNSGDRVYVSPTTAGSLTNVRPTTNGQVVIEVGRITSTLTYDGATDLLAQILLIDGERTVVGSGGGSGGGSTTYTNANAGAITEGQVVYISAADSVDLASGAANNAAARAIGLVADSSIAPAASGEIQTIGALPGRFEGSLTLNVGEEVFLSQTTAGSLTNDPDTNLGAGVVQSMGYIKNLLSYDGTTDFLAEVELVRGPRLILG